MHNAIIIFGGRSSEDYGLRISRDPDIIHAKRKIKVYSVDGRNGNIIFPENAWENYDQTYEIYAVNTDDEVQKEGAAIAEWLNGLSGYQVLEDSYEPDYFRLAYYSGSLNMTNRFSRLGKANIIFSCRPERFLKNGMNEITISSTGRSIFNPSDHAARPLIKVNGTASGSVTIGSNTMQIDTITDYLWIDCEEMEVYRGANENRNSAVRGNFFSLEPGDSTITFTGGISSLVITPRWWII